LSESTREWVGGFVLLNGILTLILVGYLVRTRGDSNWERFLYRLFGLSIILTAALLIVVINGGRDAQFSAVMSLLGTAVGYVLGKDAPEGGSQISGTTTPTAASRTTAGASTAANAPAAVQVSPANQTIAAGGTLALAATATTAAHNPLASAAFDWDSSDPACADVDTTGKVTAKAAGTATITATEKTSKIAGSTQVTVK
jgi:hypothetical protein